MKPRYLLIGLALDLLDYLALGLLPLAGDLIDLAGTALWLHLLGPTGLAGGLELIPLWGDLLPTHTVLGYMADRRMRKR